MSDDELPRILASSKRALVGAVSPGMRAVWVTCHGTDTLLLTVCFESAPTEEEMENMEVVMTEVLADVPFNTVLPVQIIVSQSEIDMMAVPGHQIYIRG